MLNKGAARGIMWLMVFGPPVKMFTHPYSNRFPMNILRLC